MDTTKATATAVEATRIKKGFTRFELSESSGIPRATLYRRLDGHSPFTVDELDRIGRALGVDPVTLLRFQTAVA